MKTLVSVIFLLLSFPLTASASLSSMLSDSLRRDEGLFFACMAELEGGRRLLTASAAGGGVAVRAYDDSDGDALDDELYISDTEKNLRLSLIRSGGTEYLLLTGGETHCFTLLDDTFYTVPAPDEYTAVTGIAALRRGTADTLGNTRGAAYNLLNKMKLEKRYGFIDRAVSMDTASLGSLRRMTAACADIMRYDSHEPDTDRLMRYILSTNANFKIVSSLSPNEGGGEIQLVSADYIEDIARRIFGIEPPRPRVNELTERGYCYDNGLYRYTRAFSASFATELRDIFAVYDLGGGVCFVVFGDIYTENGVSVPEISYAVYQKTGAQLRLLRLGMGGDLPDERELLTYSGGGKYTKFAWEEKKVLAKRGGLWYNVCAFFEKLITRKEQIP